MITDRLGFRASAALRAQVKAAGDESAVARALLILGLASAGLPIEPYRNEAMRALGGVTEPKIQQALLALFNKGSTIVEQTLNAAPIVEDDDDPFLGAGVEV